MSFSLITNKPSKAEALEDIEFKLDQAIANDAGHKADGLAVLNTVEAYTALLEDDATCNFSISVSGSYTRAWNDTSKTYDGPYTAFGVSVTVQKHPKV
jgi:hypothetical protein